MSTVNVRLLRSESERVIVRRPTAGNIVPWAPHALHCDSVAFTDVVLVMDNIQIMATMAMHLVPGSSLANNVR